MARTRQPLNKSVIRYHRIWIWGHLVKLIIFNYKPAVDGTEVLRPRPLVAENGVKFDMLWNKREPEDHFLHNLDVVLLNSGSTALAEAEVLLSFQATDMMWQGQIPESSLFRSDLDQPLCSMQSKCYIQSLDSRMCIIRSVWSQQNLSAHHMFARYHMPQSMEESLMPLFLFTLYYTGSYC